MTTSTALFNLVTQYGAIDPVTLSLVAALVGAGVLLRSLRLLREGKEATLRKLIGAVQGERAGRCGTARQYEFEFEAFGKACETCREAQVKREFARDGY